MPMKQLLHRLQPIQVYIVLVMSILYFLVQMFVSQKSQSITLLVHAYHMLCNIIALSGCIITIKNNDHESKRLSNSSSESSADFNQEGQEQKPVARKEADENRISEKKTQQRQHEKSLKNTFGWARVDVLTMVIVCTFMTSLCFSIVVEVIQTLFHIDHNDHKSHKDDFHAYPNEIIIILGALGLVLNGISYLLIGGYTYHQGSFLQLTADGNVYILDRVDDRKISDSKVTKPEQKSQKFHDLSRDVCSAVIVIICSMILLYFQGNEAMGLRLIDPVFSLISISFLLGLSYPYMKEAASVLLQTIPDCIDIGDFQKQILQKFPEVESIHDLHIWQLTQQKFVSTAHIIFQDPAVYKTIINEVLAFFHEQGINIVTIQPEFKTLGHGAEAADQELRSMLHGTTAKDLCLVACKKNECEEKLCCKPNGFEGSNESVACGNDVHLEQVVSVKNISADELNMLSNFTSVKSLNYDESIDSSQNDLGNKKRSSTSLYNPPTTRHKHKLQKALSSIDRDHQIPSASTSSDIHLISIKKFVSESVIKSGEVGQSSEILVENKMLKQLDTTDNNEIEDLFEKCDKEKRSTAVP